MSKKSASQLKTYRLCPRKWAFQYRLGLVPPTHPSAALGTAVHKVAEDWLRTGIPFNVTTNIGMIFSAGVKHLPLPGPHILLEHAFQTDDFRGYIDAFLPDTKPRPLVIDHKTTSGKGWALTVDKLADDEQAIIYGHAALKHTGADSVDAKWIYYLTKGHPESWTVERTFFKTELDSKYESLVKLSHEIDKTPEDPMQARGNMSACKAFGGCPFLNMCHGEKKNMSELLSKLKAMQAAKTNGAVVANQIDPINPPELKASVPVQPKATAKPVAVAKAPTPSAEPLAAVTEGYTLYVNCVPSGGYIDLSSYLHNLSKTVAENSGKDHYRMVEYGGGTALLEVALEQQLEREPLSGDVFVDTYGRAASDVIGVLVAHATKVVRSIR